MGRLKVLQPRLAEARPRLAQAAPATEADRLRQRNARRAIQYGAAWQRLRLRILERDGWTCQRTGVLLVGAHPAGNSPVVHHKVPHRGDPDLFWDEANLETVSKQWHDSEGQREDLRGGGV